MAINDPRDIPDLVLWYSAEAETGYSEGQSMTQWTDWSGNENHAIAAGDLPPQWEGTTGPGGGASVRFRGTHGSTSATWGYFSLPASLMGAAGSGEILVQIKSDGADCSTWGFGADSGSSNASHYPFSGTIYESWGTSARKTAGSPVLSIVSWRRYNVWSALNDFACRLDATPQFSTSDNTVLWDTVPTLGHGKRAGALSDNVGSFQGRMAAVVVYSRKLTTTERDDLDTWLATNPNGGLPVAPPVVTLVEKMGAAVTRIRDEFNTVRDEMATIPAGADGDSAYDVAVANGFVGTEAEWLASLEGPQGEQGIQGPQGDPGVDGADGADGADGLGVVLLETGQTTPPGGTPSGTIVYRKV